MADLQHDIEKYLKGELSPAERHRLEKMALGDPFLAEALEGGEEIDPVDFKNDLDNIHLSLDSRIAKKEKKNSTWIWPMRIAAGIVIVICSTFLVYLFLDQKGNEELAMHTIEVAPSVESKPEDLAFDSSTVTTTKENVTQFSPSEKKSEPEKTKASPSVKKDVPVQATPVEEPEHFALSEQAEEREEKAAPVPAVSQPIELAPTKNEQAGRAKKSAPQASSADRAASGIISGTIAPRTIRGKVVDLEDGSPLPGVNVTVKDGTLGTTTDLDGNFQLSIDASVDALLFSFIGFETKEEIVTDRSQLVVQLDQDVAELSEVVVTGYGYDNSSVFTDNTVSDFVQAEPEGGFKAYKLYLDNNLHYPIQAIENQVQGKVTVRFEIAPNGTLSDFQVTKGIGFGCDEEAIRLIRQGPKWTSPKRGDEAVKGRVKVKLKFTLPK